MAEDLATGLQRALALLRDANAEDARRLLCELADTNPQFADVWQLLALAEKQLEDFAAAEAAFLESIRLQPQAHVLTNLGNLYRHQAKHEEALQQYQRALELDQSHVPAEVNRGQSLLALQRLTAAEESFNRVLQNVPDYLNARVGLAQVLQQQGRQAEAIDMFQQVLVQQPANLPALNGMGISLKVLGFAEDAVELLTKACHQSPESVEIWVNLASAFAQADRDEEAVAAYQRAIALDPLNPELHEWCNGYLGVIDHPEHLHSYQQALEAEPAAAELAAPYARKLLLLNRADEALAVLDACLRHSSNKALLLCERSHILRESGEFPAAVAAARSAFAQDVSSYGSRRELATALMASGDAYKEACNLLSQLLTEHPQDQGILALYATALRYTEAWDEYRRLIDYQTMVHVRTVVPGMPTDTAVPETWTACLLALHTTNSHPIEQSMVGGTQTLDDLFSRAEPELVQLQSALAEQIRAVLSGLPSLEDHPLYGRNSGNFRFSDSWSVRLHRQGFHKNHYHSAGWLSSAYYVRVPDAVDRGGEGWIKFGEPGFRAREPLPAEYWVKPRAGQLVMFPSYLWHGTEPLVTASERITIGYDILPGE